MAHVYWLSTAVVDRIQLMRAAHIAALAAASDATGTTYSSDGDMLGAMIEFAKRAGAPMTHDGLTKERAVATARSIARATLIRAITKLLPEYFSLAVAETEALVDKRLTPGASAR